jgi:hypothetical protein
MMAKTTAVAGSLFMANSQKRIFRTLPTLHICADALAPRLQSLDTGLSGSRPRQGRLGGVIIGRSYTNRGEIVRLPSTNSRGRASCVRRSATISSPRTPTDRGGSRSARRGTIAALSYLPSYRRDPAPSRWRPGSEGFGGSLYSAISTYRAWVTAPTAMAARRASIGQMRFN